MTSNNNNIFKNIPKDLPEELVEILAAGTDVRIERIVSRGHKSPEDFWYDQPLDEWVILLGGKATLEFADGKTRDMTPGDHINIPAHQKHRVASTAPNTNSTWLAVHYKPQTTP